VAAAICRFDRHERLQQIGAEGGQHDRAQPAGLFRRIGAQRAQGLGISGR